MSETRLHKQLLNITTSLISSVRKHDKILKLSPNVKEHFLTPLSSQAIDFFLLDELVVCKLLFVCLFCWVKDGQTAP